MICYMRLLHNNPVRPIIGTDDGNPEIDPIRPMKPGQLLPQYALEADLNSSVEIRLTIPMTDSREDISFCRNEPE